MAKNETNIASETAKTELELAGALGIPEGWKLYLAYGQDMDPEWMAGSCPTARFITDVFLGGLGLCADADGYATIRQENSNLHGSIWAVSPDDIETLEVLAGIRSGARRKELVKVPVSVKPTGNRGRSIVNATAFTYVSNKVPYSYGPGNPAHFAEIRRTALKKGVSGSSLDRITNICIASGVEVEPTTSADDYLDYVCADCFLPLGKCSCSSGWTRRLLHIDRGIQDVVAVLNRKGYKTEYCCEGHSPRYSTYLSFREGYGIGEVLSVPEGFKFVKSRSCLEAVHSKKASEEELAKRKVELLAHLTAWCEGLPSRTESLDARWLKVIPSRVDLLEEFPEIPADVVEMPDIADVEAGDEYIAKKDMHVTNELAVIEGETWTVLRKFEAFVHLGNGGKSFWLDGWTFLKTFE